MEDKTIVDWKKLSVEEIIDYVDVARHILKWKSLTPPQKKILLDIAKDFIERSLV